MKRLLAASLMLAALSALTSAVIVATVQPDFTSNGTTTRVTTATPTSNC